uniref:H-2 class II histocompatibility antigen, A-U alpha chain-like n=1 Tax=Myripristis murdjan TaxID=586833 RepID=A0A667ZCU7_9TELE
NIWTENLLLFVCRLFGSAVSCPGPHEGIVIAGCSDTDAEEMYGLDGEERWYADFKNHRGVIALPKFADQASYTGFYELAEAQHELCKHNLAADRRAYKNPPPELDAPHSTIYTRNRVELDVENHLICHVSGFFPAPVSVYWTRNDQNVTEGTSINTPYPSKDGTFTQISTLKFTPQQGDIYSCTVQHPALEQPLTRVWDVEQDQPGIGPAVFCGLGLTVGLLGVATGTFFLIKGNECS